MPGMHFRPLGIPAGHRTRPGRQWGAAPAAAAILPALLLAILPAALPAAVATGTVTGPASADESTALPPSFVWERVPGLAWRTCGNARIEGGVMEISLPEAGDGWAEADIDLSGYDGEGRLAALRGRRIVRIGRERDIALRAAVWPGGLRLGREFRRKL